MNEELREQLRRVAAGELADLPTIKDVLNKAADGLRADQDSYRAAAKAVSDALPKI